MNLARTLTRAARCAPEAPAISVGRRQVWAYGGLADRVSRLAAGFGSRLALEPGARIAIAMTNRPEFLETLYAAWHGGFCAVPVNPRLHRREFAYIFENSGAEVCVCSPDLAPALEGLDGEIETLRHLVVADGPGYADLAGADGMAMADVSPTDPAWIFYTSGTTGRPKGATLSHRNLAFMSQSYLADIDRIAPGHTMLHAAALSHGSGLYALPHISQGGHQVVTESRSFDPSEIVDLVHALPQVSFFAAPTMLTRLVAAVDAAGGDPLANLRTIVYGGGPMYVADLQHALQTLGPRLAQIFGQGESPMTITSLSKRQHLQNGRIAGTERLASCGIARTLVEVRAVDDEGRDVPVGEVGEVVTRSDCVMSGYWNAPEASAAALKDGWLHTGDLGAFDAHGFLSLRDRSKDMIVSAASNIYPREVEEVLLQHTDVEEVSVVGRPHPDLVEEVVAFVVSRPGSVLTGGVLDRHCLDNMARYKRPRAWFFVPDLPKNNYGKVLKTELRDRAGRPSLAAGGA